MGKNTTLYFAGDLLSKGVYYLLLLVYSYYLDPAEYGILGVVSSLTSLLAILFSLQIASALTMEYFHLDHSTQQDYVTVSWVTGILVALIFSIALLIGGKMIFQEILPDIPFKPYLSLGIGSAFLAVFAFVPQALFRLREQPIRYVGFNLIGFALNMAISLALVVGLRMQAVGVLIATLIGNLLIAVLYVGVMAKEINPRFRLDLLKRALPLALPLVPHMLAHWGLNLSDRIILQAYVPLDQVGIYQLGYQVGMGYQMVVIAVNNAWLPFFLRMNADGSEKKSTKQLGTWIIVGESVVGFAIILVGEELIKLFAPDVYKPAADYIIWIVIGFFFVSIYHMMVNVLFLQKKTTLLPLATLIAAVINIGLNIFTVPLFGPIAAAINTMVGYACLCGFVFLITKKYATEYVDYLEWVKVGLCGFVLLLVSRFFPTGNWIGLSIKMFWVMVYVWFLYRLGYKEWFSFVRSYMSRFITR